MEHLSTLPEEFSLLRRELGKTTDRHYKSLRLLYENLPARSSQYSTLRPTRLAKIKNFCPQVQAGGVVLNLRRPGDSA